MNSVCLVGNITTKPELRYTDTGISTTRFNLAVNRTFSNSDGKREADFIPIQVWRKQAENVCQYLDKGSKISVIGRIQTSNYTDQDGNKRSTWVVVAGNIQFLNSKKSSAENTANNLQTTAKEEHTTDLQDEDPFSDFGDEIDVDDNYLD